jgi:acyl-coenzyme A synthetase/AMP-(fatty) acid ligase
MNFFKTLDKFGPNVALYTEGVGAVSYGELLKQADEVGRSIPNRSLVFILCGNNIESVEGYVGVERAGSVAVLLDTDIRDVFLEKLLHTFKPHFVYLHKKNLADFSKQIPSLQSPSIACKNGSYVLVKTHVDADYSLHEDLALLLTTSGSTGTKKLVRQSYRNIDANTRSIVQYLGITEGDRAITTLPMSYTYGLSIIQSHLFMGSSIILSDASVLEKRFWNLCKKFEATTFGGVPYTFEILKRIGFENMNLPHMQYVTQAGGKLSKELCDFFVKSCLEKNMRFIVMYGQTEATARMSYVPWEDALRKAGSIGIPIPGGAMHLEDTNGNLITDADVSGELIYEGDNVSLGYAEDDTDLSKGDENKGVLRTGDIAKRDTDGYYYIVGRRSRFVKVLGKRVNLDEIEAWLRKEGLDCACAGGDDAVRVYITDTGAEQNVRDLLKQIFDLRAPSVTIHIINEIPRNSSNKIEYASLP